MRYLVFSDLHAHPHKRYRRTMPDGTNSWLAQSLSILRDLREYAIENEITHIVFGGDLFDANNRIPVHVISMVLEELYRWATAGLEVLLIPGNHDHAVRSGEYHGLQVLNAFPTFTVVDEPGRLQWHGLDVVAAPYRRHNKAEWVCSDELRFCTVGEPRLPRLFLGHGCVEGVCGLPVELPADPMEPHEDWYRREWLMRGSFDYVIVGHIHNPSLVDWEDGPLVLVPGCPYADTSNAGMEERGFWVLDTDARTMTQEPLFYPQFCHLVLDPTYPERRGRPTDLPPHQIWIAPDDLERMSGQIAMVQWRSESPLSAADVNRLKQMLSDAGAVYVDVQTSFEHRRGNPRIALDIGGEPLELWESLVKDPKTKLQGRERDAIIRWGVEFLKSAQNNRRSS